MGRTGTEARPDWVAVEMEPEGTRKPPPQFYEIGSGLVRPPRVEQRLEVDNRIARAAGTQKKNTQRQRLLPAGRENGAGRCCDEMSRSVTVDVIRGTLFWE